VGGVSGGKVQGEVVFKKIEKEGMLMRYKKLKCAGIDVSVMSAGTWSAGARNTYGAVDRNESIRSIRAMIEQGINFIDTAPVYGNGYAEQVVAEVIEGMDREKLVILTKFGLIPNIHHRTGSMVRDLGYKNIMREVQSSLVNMGTDYIDVYMMHYFDENTPLSETMSALSYLKDQGFIRYIGVSNFTQEQVEEAQKYGKIDVLQMAYSMVNKKNEPFLKWASANGIDIMGYASLGSGILTGAIRSLPNFVDTDVRSFFYGELYTEPKFSRIMKLLEKMDVIADAHGKPVAHVALNWSAQKDFMTTNLVGVRDVQEAAENCAAFDWELSDEEMAALDKALIELEL
jgi:aryl-alcohol dehydrogenase-like predicted oxidoreductase